MSAKDEPRPAHRGLLLLLAAVYVVVVVLAFLFAMRRSRAPLSYACARPLPANHRVEQWDFRPHPGLPAPTALLGRYTRRSLRKGDELMEPELSIEPDLAVEAGQALLPVALKERPYLLGSLDSGSCVMLCPPGGPIAGEFEVRAITCDRSGAPACAALIVVPAAQVDQLTVGKEALVVLISSPPRRRS